MLISIISMVVETEWYTMQCQHWHIADVFHHHLWMETAWSSGLLEFFSILWLFSKNSDQYFRDSIPPTSSVQIWQVFPSLSFWVDIIYTLKSVPFFVKRIGHFSAKWLHKPVRLHWPIVSFFGFKERSQTENHDGCTWHMHHRTCKEAWISFSY